jgi:CAAX protease family protein
LGVAAAAYSHDSQSSHWIMTGLLPAFMIEAMFFLTIGFEQTRMLFARISPRRLQSLIMIVSGTLPYVIAARSAGTFDQHAFLILLGLCVVVSCWYWVLPHRIVYDVGFLVIVAAVIVLRVFGWIYISPAPRLKIDILGHLMWIRLAIIAMLIQRGWDVGPVSFWPKRREWQLGLVQFALMIVPLFLFGCLVHLVSFAPKQGDLLKIAGSAIGTFFGILWVVALSEELFFRGVIAKALLEWKKSMAIAIGVSSVAFGSAHLWMRDFPNWKMACAATIAGIFFARAYFLGGSVRAAMVTHALAVTTWRMLFR